MALCSKTIMNRVNRFNIYNKSIHNMINIIKPVDTTFTYLNRNTLMTCLFLWNEKVNESKFIHNTYFTLPPTSLSNFGYSGIDSSFCTPPPIVNFPHRLILESQRTMSWLFFIFSCFASPCVFDLKYTQTWWCHLASRLA